MTRREAQYRPIVESEAEAPGNVSPMELYRREKARRLANPGDTSELLAEARREYEALLAADAAKGKGGRPRKTARRAADLDAEDEE